MTRQPEKNPSSPQPDAQRPTSFLEKCVYLVRQTFTVIILPGVIIVAGIWGAMRLIESGPKAERRERKHNAPLVEVKALMPTDETIIVHAMGTVIPSRQINLYPEISGRIIAMDDHMEPGGKFKRGQTLFQIDPSDFELAIEQKQAAVDQVQAEYRIEQGQQATAKQEYELLGQDINEQDRDLILRKPQLQTIAAKLKSAQAQVEQAKLDLARTTISAPFNALVLERNVNIGSHITTGTALTQIVGTDTYWVQVSVPVDQLKWITIPSADIDTGSTVRIYNEAAWGKTVHRVGHVIRLAGSLEQQGRMAQLLVAVDDPIALKHGNTDTPPLLLDSYVRVEIDGTVLHDVYRIPRTALQHDDQIHLFKDGSLDVRDIKIIHRGPTDVIVESGIKPEEMLITSNLSAPVQNMPLRTESKSQMARTNQEAQPKPLEPQKALEQ